MPPFFKYNNINTNAAYVDLSFMMAVTTLSLPSLIMLRKVVKPKLLRVGELSFLIRALDLLLLRRLWMVRWWPLERYLKRKKL